MTYAKMLDDIIKKSDLSLRQIAKHCEDLNLKITPSYISQLKNGKLPPPSEEVSLILAKVCGSDKQAHLVFQGYMEKAPSMIKEYMLASSTLNKVMLESLCKAANKAFTKEMEDYIKELDVLAALELSSEYVSTDDPQYRNNLVREICLSCGDAVEADSKGEMINLFLADSSMSPYIPVHAYIYIIPTREELLKDRDIIAFYPDNRRVPTLRRIYFIKGKILLIPDEKSHETYFFDDITDIEYIGKVVSFKVDI
ncbi:MAG TPA: S24 family peptidase [Bacillota bacterium]|nr:S24 family peptidase [Bacillota bacterium]